MELGEKVCSKGMRIGLGERVCTKGMRMGLGEGVYKGDENWIGRERGCVPRG